MNKVTRLIRSVLFACIGSIAISLLILKLFPNSNQNSHWLFSVAFHALVAVTYGIIAILNPDPKVLASNLLSISLGRLLVSAIAFLIYRLTFPTMQKWFMVHFMIHYALFTFFEIVFLLKIVNSKTSTK